MGSQVARMAHGLVLTVLFITSCGLFTPLIGSCLPICQIACLIALYFVVLTLDLWNIPSAISLGSQNSQGIRSGCGSASDCNHILSLMTWELCLNRKSVHSWMRNQRKELDGSRVLKVYPTLRSWIRCFLLAFPHCLCWAWAPSFEFPLC